MSLSKTQIFLFFESGNYVQATRFFTEFQVKCRNFRRLLLTTVKHALSVSLYEGIIFLSYFKEKRIKKCQRKDVEESVDKIIANRMSKAYSEWKSNQDTQSFNENIEKEYQKLLETLSPEQEKVLTKYCDEIFASGAETEEFFYRLGIKDGLRLKSTVKSVLEMMS